MSKFKKDEIKRYSLKFDSNKNFSEDDSSSIDYSNDYNKDTNDILLNSANKKGNIILNNKSNNLNISSPTKKVENNKPIKKVENNTSLSSITISEDTSIKNKKSISSIINIKKDNTSYINKKVPPNKNKKDLPIKNKNITNKQIKQKNKSKILEKKIRNKMENEMSNNGLVDKIKSYKIDKYLRNNIFSIQKAPFQRFINNIKDEILKEECLENEDFRLNPDSLKILQSLSENYLITLFEDSYLLTLHADRVTWMDRDIRLMRRIRMNNGLGY